MAPEIKFTATGIPYVVEFANISLPSTKHIKRRRTKPPTRSNTYPIFRPFFKRSTMENRAAYDYPSRISSASSWRSYSSGTTTSSAFTASASDRSSLTLVDAPVTQLTSVKYTPDKRHAEPGDNEGLFIQYATPQSPPRIFERPLSSYIYVHPSGSCETLHQADSRNAVSPPAQKSPGDLQRLRRAIVEAIQQVGMLSPSNHPSSDSDGRQKGLYSGTFAQVEAALTVAGLIAVSCPENGPFDGATRLGTMFIAQNNGNGGLKFKNLTLWG